MLRYEQTSHRQTQATAQRYAWGNGEERRSAGSWQHMMTLFHSAHIHVHRFSLTPTYDTRSLVALTHFVGKDSYMSFGMWHGSGTVPNSLSCNIEYALQAILELTVLRQAEFRTEECVSFWQTVLSHAQNATFNFTFTPIYCYCYHFPVYILTACYCHQAMKWIKWNKG